jgi:hypothetical protein
MGQHHAKKPLSPYRYVYIFLGTLAGITAAIWTMGLIHHG